jgi:hypothetical protein
MGPGSNARAQQQAPNPAIDMPAYQMAVEAAARHRETHRLSEAEFLRVSRMPGVVILDARSKEKYDLLHVAGAINLNFSDITVESLKRVLPDRNARILIYCNNNFKSSEEAFPSKMPSAALNLSTYITLYNYGYRNVYELAPLLDPKTSKLRFEGSKSKS